MWSLLRLINWGLRDYGVDGQLGLEKTPDEYVSKMVAVFREVRRALRDDGTLWLNIGDCYNSIGHKKSNSGYGTSGLSGGPQVHHPLRRENAAPDLKHKDLVGIPWRLAFALQADGWWLRSDIVWAKPNPMPESVRDRPTRAHEYVFLLTKSARYFYDADAIRTEAKRPDGPNAPDKISSPYGQGYTRRAQAVPAGWSDEERHDLIPAGRYPAKERAVTPNGKEHGTLWDDRRRHDQLVEGANARTVWTIATEPYPDAHFATFPTELARRCILAGTSAAGACSHCGAPLLRAADVSYVQSNGHGPASKTGRRRDARKNGRTSNAQGGAGLPVLDRVATTTGWIRSCTHFDADIRPCLVLDPFAGSGTTLLVADILGRHATGLELNPAYVALAEKRLLAPRSPEAQERANLEAQGQTTLF